MAYRISRIRRIVALMALAFWLASLILPAARFETPGYEYVTGLAVAIFGLLFGWAAFQFGAFANPLFLAVCTPLLFGKRPGPAVILAIFAEILALWSFTWANFPDDIHENKITHFSTGFYAWQISILIITLYVLLEESGHIKDDKGP